jgi:hypothetical protein
MTSSRASFLCLLFSLSGCAASHERGGSHPDDDGRVEDDDFNDGIDWGDEDELDGDSSSDDSDDDLIEDPELPPPECGRAAPLELPRLIAHDIDVERVAVGPCGELAYESADTLHVLDAAYARELATGVNMSAPRFSPDGALLTASGQNNVMVLDLVSEERREVPGEGRGFLLQTSDWWHDDVSQPRSVPVVCNSSGLGLFLDGAVDVRFPGRACVPGAFDDWSGWLWGEYGSTVLYRDEDGDLHAADFLSGLDTIVAVELIEGNGWGFDFLHLSDDGRVLVHVAGWDEACGDTFCPMSDGTATLFDLTTQLTHHGLPAALVGNSHEVNIIDGPPGSHRMAIQGATDMTLIASADQLVASTVRNRAPLQIVGRRDEVLGRQYPDGALELVPFTGGGATTISPTSEEHDPWDPPDVAVSWDGSVIAYSAYRARRCETNPALDPCQTQLWEVVVWSREHGELAAHLTSQPASPLWVGDDGSVLVYGPLAGHNEGFGWGDFVLDTAGNVLAQLPDSEQVTALSDGFLLATPAEVMGGGTDLWRFDVTTGTSATVALQPASVPAGADLAVWVDPAEQRLVYAFHWYDAASSRDRSQLYAGQLPRL